MRYPFFIRPPPKEVRRILSQSKKTSASINEAVSNTQLFLLLTKKKGAHAWHAA